MKFIEQKLGDIENAIIIPISDCHAGEQHFDRRKFEDLIRTIEKTDNMYTFLIGDLMNNATKAGKSDLYGDNMSPQKQLDYIEDVLSPIQEKILGATIGNHENRTYKETGTDPMSQIAKYLHVPYDHEGLLINMKLGHTVHNNGAINYTTYATHGSGGGCTKGSRIGKLHSLKDVVLADLYVMGHFHDCIATSDMYFVPDERHSRIIKKKRYFCIAGNYVNWGGYAETLSLKPNPTGFPVINLSGTSKKITITI